MGEGGGAGAPDASKRIKLSTGEEGGEAEGQMWLLAPEYARSTTSSSGNHTRIFEKASSNPPPPPSSAKAKVASIGATLTSFILASSLANALTTAKASISPSPSAAAAAAGSSNSAELKKQSAPSLESIEGLLLAQRILEEMSSMTWYELTQMSLFMDATPLPAAPHGEASKAIAVGGGGEEATAQAAPSISSQRSGDAAMTSAAASSEKSSSKKSASVEEKITSIHERFVAPTSSSSPSTAAKGAASSTSAPQAAPKPFDFAATANGGMRAHIAAAAQKAPNPQRDQNPYMTKAKGKAKHGKNS